MWHVVCCGVFCYCAAWYSVVEYGMVWCGLVWCGVVWYVVVNPQNNTPRFIIWPPEVLHQVGSYCSRYFLFGKIFQRQCMAEKCFLPHLSPALFVYHFFEFFFHIPHFIAFCHPTFLDISIPQPKFPHQISQWRVIG